MMPYSQLAWHVGSITAPRTTSRPALFLIEENWSQLGELQKKPPEQAEDAAAAAWEAESSCITLAWR